MGYLSLEGLGSGDIAMPVAGRLLVSASVDARLTTATSSYFKGVCQAYAGPPNQPTAEIPIGEPSHFTLVIPATQAIGPVDQQVSIEAAVPVPAGSYDVSVRCSAPGAGNGGGGTLENATLNVIGVAS